MIRAEGLQRHFALAEGAVRAVDGLDLAVAGGEFVAVMGPSGSGKSTLLYLLGAMDRPTGGRLRIADSELASLSDRRRSRFRNATLGFVFQSFQLLPRLDLLRNVELPMVYAGVAAAARRERARVLLAALGLAGREGRPPTELSGGQCQRAAIARALVNRPRLLLADEPTGNLDSRTGLEVMAIFQALHRQGLTLVMVTHDETMARHATRILRMRDGRLVDDQPVRDRLAAALPDELAATLAGALAPAASGQGAR